MKPIAPLVATVFALASTTWLNAASRSWTGANGSDFEVSSNWSAIPTNDLSTDIAVFSGSVPNNQPRLSVSRSVNGLSFTTPSGGWTLSAAAGDFTLSLGSSGMSTAGQTSGFNTVSTNIALGTTQTWQVGTGGTLTLSGSIQAGSSTTSTLAGQLIVGGGSNAGQLVLDPSAGRAVAIFANMANSAAVQVNQRLRLGSVDVASSSVNTLYNSASAGIRVSNTGVLEVASGEWRTNDLGSNNTAAFSGTLIVSGGTLATGGGRYIGQYNGAVGSNITVSGGTLAVTGGGNNVINAGYLGLGVNGVNSPSGTVTLTVTGGTVDVAKGVGTLPAGVNSAAFVLGGIANTTALVNQSGGSVRVGVTAGSHVLTGVANANATSNLSIGSQANANAAAYTLGGGKLIVAGSVQGVVSAGGVSHFNFIGGTLAVGGFNATNLSHSPSATISSGQTASGSGLGSLTQRGGVLAPGDVGVTGLTSVTGDYTLTAGSMAIDLGGTTAATSFQHGAHSNTHDQLSVTGTATLGGSLSVSLVPGFSATPTDVFAIMTCGNGVSGSFSNVAFGSRVVSSDGLHSFVVNSSGNRVTLSDYAPVTPPAITDRVTPSRIIEGDAVMLSVSAQCPFPFSYEWRKNGVLILGANSSSFTLASASAADAGNYEVRASNAAGAVTQSFTVKVLPPNRTQSIVIDAGSTQTFNATAAAVNRVWTLDGETVGNGAASYSYNPSPKAVGRHWLQLVETDADAATVTRQWDVRVRIPTVTTTRVYHVSPNGSDAADGSLNAPFASLEKARDVIRLLTTAQRAGGVTVYLRGGIHRRTTTFSLTGQDSGTTTAPIIYAAYPGETPILTSTRVIASAQWSPLASSELARVAPGVDASRIWEYNATGNARAAAFPAVFNEWTIFNALRSSQNGGLFEVFYKGERQRLSRYPNVNLTDDTLTTNLAMNGVAAGSDYVGPGETATGYLNGAGTYTYADGVTTAAVGAAFHYSAADASRIERWSTALSRGGVWLSGYWRVPWQVNGARVGLIDPVKRVIGFVPSSPNANSDLISNGIGNKYVRPVGSFDEPWWALNLLEELDQPGEWCIDFSRQRLYFLMDRAGSPADGEVELADVGTPMFQLNSVSDVRLQGLTFRRHLGINVQILDGARNYVLGCAFTQPGNMAVDINGGTGHGVVSSDFEKMASGGVILRGGTLSPALVSADHFAVNNRFRSFGEVVRVYQAAIDVGFGGPMGSWGLPTVGMRVAQNDLRTSPHAGILWNGYQHAIEYNEASDFTRISEDLGAIYRFGPNIDSGTVIRYNHLFSSPQGEGIYNDMDHVRVRIYGNTVNLQTPATSSRGYGIWTNTNTASGGAVVGLPMSLRVFNNIAVNSRSNYSLHSAVGGTIENNVSFGKLASDFLWYRITTDAATATNSITTSDAATLQSGPNPSYTTDPGFINYAANDLRLRPDSRVFLDLPNFKPIPLEMSGLFNDELRQSASARVRTPFVVSELASGVNASVANLKGTLVYPQFDPNTNVRVYWGTTDGGTDAAAWQNMVNLGQPSSGELSVPLTNLTAGTRYYYRFYAVNAAGEHWAERTRNTIPIVPAVPSNLIVTPGVASNTLVWSAAANATGYTVSRALSSGGPYRVIATGLTSTTFTDTGLFTGTPYYYTVTAIGNDADSAAAAEVAGSPVPGVFNKANNTTALDLSASWTAQSVPSALDSVLWTGTYANGVVSIGSGLSVQQLRIGSPSTAISLAASTGPLTLGAGGFDLSAATQSLTVFPPVVLAAPQTWSLAASRLLNLAGTISDASAGHALTLSGAGSYVFPSTNAFSGPLTLSGATLHLGPSAGGLTGTLGTGDFTLSSGTLRYNRLDAQAPIAGRFNATAGTIQVNYAAGSFTLNSTNLPAGSVNSFASVSGASGATFVVDAAPSASLTFGSSTAGLNVTARNGLISFSTSSPASNLRIEGGTFTSTATDRFQLATANQTFSVTGGTVNLTAAASLGLRIGGSNGANNSGAQTVTAAQSGGSIAATTLSIGGNDTSATKNPAYTLSGGTLALSSTGSTALQIGADTAGLGTSTFTLSGTGVLRVPGTITGAQSGAKQIFAFTGGTLAANAVNATNLRSAADGTNGTFAQSGGTLAPGNVGTAGRTAITGAYNLGVGATLAVELGGNSAATVFQTANAHDQLTVSGTTTLAGNLSVALLPGYTPAAGSSFTVLSSTGALSGAFANVGFGDYLTATDGVTLFSVSQSGNSVVLARVLPTPPVITAEPVSQSVGSGAPTTLTVTASGIRLTYQWRKDGVAIPGATSASYSLSAAQITEAGLYDVIVSNAVGSVTSAPARLAVAPAWTSPAAFIYDLNSSAPVANGTVPDTTGRTVGTLISSPSPALISGPNASSGNAWDFTSSNAFIRIASNPVIQSLGDINATRGLSVGFWINYNWRSNADNNLRVLGLTNCLDVLSTDTHGDGIIHFRLGNGINIPQITLASPRVLDGTWHHLVATLDFTRSTANAKLYVDGALAVTQSQPIQANFTGGTSNFILGARNTSSSSANNPLRGRLDQFAVFTRALDAAEITQLYSAAAVANYAPTVTAAASATTVVAPSIQTTLVATATDDGQPTPAALTGLWSKVSGPGTVTFAAPSALVSNATFSALGSYVLRFTASDGALSSSADVTVNVVNNTAPTVFASTPTTVVGPASAAIRLDGAATDDGLPGLSPVSFLWTQLSGPGSAIFANSAAASTTVTLPTGVTGNYVLQLSASDGALTGTASVFITVASNLAPVVHAVSARPAFAWTASGANSAPVLVQASDDGLPNSPGSLAYAWTLVNGPGTAVFANPSAAETSVTVGAPGVYRVRVTVSDGTLSTSDDLWLNAIAANPAIPVPTGVAVRSATPPPYEHPRIFFTDADHAALRAAALTDPVASAGRISLVASVAATLDNPATALGAAYIQLKAGNTAYNTQALTQSQTAPNDAMIGTADAGLYGNLAAASYLAWLDRDNASVRLRELATAVATAARNHATWWPADRAAQPTPVEFNKDTYSDLGFCYDLLYDWMTEDQRYAVRSLLAAQTSGRLTLGANEPDYSLSTNWRTFHDHIILASLAIEGETGHDAASLAVNRQALKTFFTQWGVGPEGFNREGPGYFGFGTHSAALALYALSRRDEDLLATTRFHQSAQEMFYQMAPDSSGRMYGANDGPGWGNGNGNTSLYAIYKAAYPEDPFIDWVTRNALAPTNSVIAASQPLIMAIWGRAPLTGNTSFAAATAAAPRPLHLFSPQRGFGVARSDWSDSALQVDFENRFDAFALGHSHAVRNHFTLFALGREWIGGQGYHYIANDLKSTVLIDGLGQSSASLQALATAGKPAVISWPPLPGKFLENIDQPLLSVFAGDAKPAYTYSWKDQSYAYNPGDVPVGSIQTPYRWKDLAYPGYIFPTPNIGDNAWADTFIRAEATPFNPVERAFRSVLTVRGTKPYVLVLDDIQKDATPRTYTWSANTVTNYNVVDMAIQGTATPSEAVLYHTPDAASGPRLLVRVMDGQGTATTPITLDNTPLDFGEGPAPARRIQITRTATVAPDFKVLLYPHQSGESLPTTTYSRSSGLLTVTLPDGTADVFRLVVQPDGRTRVASFARNGATPPTLVVPSSVNASVVLATDTVPVTFNLTATAANGSPLTAVANPPSGFAFPLGTTPVVVSTSDAAGNTRTTTFDVIVTIAPPAAPTNLVVSPGFASNVLAWSAVPGATSYSVKRATTPGGPYVVVASNLTATTFTDTGLVSGTTYYYTVTATNTAGESSGSSETSGTPPPTTVTKANNITALNLASSWTPTGVPTALDSVLWTGTYANGVVSIGSGLSVQQLRIGSPSTAISLAASTGPLTLGAGGFDLSAATQSLTVFPPVVLAAPQTWSLAASRLLNLAGTISDASAGHALTLSGAGSYVFPSTNAFSGPLTLSGATLHLGPSAGGLTGTLGTGDFTLSSGTLRYNRLDAQAPIAGRFNATAGTIQVNYAAGSFTLNSTNLPAGSVNSFASVSGASGATFVVDAAPSASLTFGSSTAGLNVTARNGLISFSTSSPASNLRIEGGTFTSTATDRFQLATANQTFSVTGGTVNLTAAASLGLRIGGSNGANNSGAQTVTAAQSGGSIAATTLSIGGNDTSATKNPAYTLSGGTLALSSTGSTALQIGADTAGLGTSTFTLSGTGVLRVPGTITGAQSGAKQIFAFTGGTLAANAVNATNLRSAADGTNGTFAQSGGTLAPGNVGTAGRTAITGAYNLGVGATLAVELGGNSAATVFQTANAHDQLTVSGTTTLAGNLSVALLPGYTPAAGSSFTVLSSTGALSGAFANVAFGQRLSTAGGEGSFLVNQVGNAVTLSGFIVAAPPLSAIESWRLSFFQKTEAIGSAANSADPDGDGMNNLLEYALAGNPLIPDNNRLPKMSLLPAPSTALQLTFTRHRADLTYTVEATSDLSAPNNWTAIPYTLPAVGQSVTVTDPTPNRRRFLRLKVSTP